VKGQQALLTLIKLKKQCTNPFLCGHRLKWLANKHNQMAISYLRVAEL